MKVIGLTRFLIATASVFSSVALVVAGPAYGAASLFDQPASIRSSTYVNRETHYRSLMRISLMGGMAVDGGNSYPSLPSGALLVDFGRGLFGLESGVQFMSIRTNLMQIDANGKTSDRYSTPISYVGIPLLLKYNYIEHPMAAFSVKAGVIPAMRTSTDNGIDPDAQGYYSASIPINASDLFAVAGFTGSAPMGDSLSFLIDGTYFHGTADVDGQGGTNSGVIFSIGAVYHL